MKKYRLLLKKSTCLIAAAAMLGGCGQASSQTASGGKSAAGAMTAVTETAADQSASDPSAPEAIGSGAGGSETSGAGAGGSETSGAGAIKPETAGAETTVSGAIAPESVPAAELMSLYDEITRKVSLRSMVVMPDSFITNYYGIDISTLEDYVFSMSEEATSAETVIIMKARDASGLEGLAAALQTVIDGKKAEMENYLPEQFQIVEQSEVKTSGSYVYLVISEQADTVNQMIEAAIQ